MKILLNKYTIGLLLTALVSVALIVMYMTIVEQSKEINRVKENNSQLLMEKDNIQLVMTKKELLKFKESLVKEIQDSLNIKPKNITNVQNVYTNYIDSSKYYMVESNDSIIKISVDEICYNFNGEVNTKLKQFKLNKIQFTDTVRIVDYWTRNKLFNVWWFPRWGEKKFYRKSYSKCNSDIKTEEIKIEKYK